MNLPFWVRRAHKWIGLVIGVQALLWMLSGLYMTAISIDVIHGDHLAHVADAPLDGGSERLDVEQLARIRPGFESLKLKKFLGQGGLRTSRRRQDQPGGRAHGRC
jgi:hypothetical protein